MRFSACVLLALAIFTSCRPTLHYKYITTLQPATKSDSLIYENDSIRIKFTIMPKLIKFRLDNKLNQGLHINWDEVSMSIAGRTYRVVHKETGTFKINDIQPTTSIPPRSYMVDGLIPTDKVNYTNVGYKTPLVTVSDIFPINDYGKKTNAEKITSLKGKPIVIYLPFYINNTFTANAFQINIDDVKPISRKEAKSKS